MNITNHTSHDRLTRAAIAVCWVLLAWMVGVAGYLSWVTYIECDEFVFAHAAWLVSKGQLPYRDFFEHHFPLVYQLLAWPLTVAGDDPMVIRLLRGLMLPILAAVLLCAWRINRSSLGRYAVVTPVVLVATLPLTRHLTQVRPDGLSFALFLGAICMLYTQRWRGTVRGLACGLLLGLSCWASQKTFVYGSVFAPALLADVLWNRHRPGRNLLGSPWAFLVGFGTVVAAVGCYLILTGTGWEFYRWCILWPIEHETSSKGYDWAPRFFTWFIKPYPWLLPIAMLGMIINLSAWVRGRDRLANPDWVLILALFTCFASFTLQSMPYRYSLIPIAGMTGIFAARGLGFIFAWVVRLHHERQWSQVSFAGIVASAVLLGGFHLASFHKLAYRDIRKDNRQQMATLESLSTLTVEDDPVYDNSGTVLTRPHAYFYFYTPWYIRKMKGTMLSQEVPPAIQESGAAVFVKDVRYPGIPKPLKRYLSEHFQPYDTDIALWGQRYDFGAAEVEGAEMAPDAEQSAEHEVTREEGADAGSSKGEGKSFHAVRDDQYFVQPGDVIEKGRLWIDGKPVTDRRFRLAQGDHEIRYDGPSRTFWLLWLPRHGRHWQPIAPPG